MMRQLTKAALARAPSLEEIIYMCFSLGNWPSSNVTEELSKSRARESAREMFDLQPLLCGCREVSDRRTVSADKSDRRPNEVKAMALYREIKWRAAFRDQLKAGS